MKNRLKYVRGVLNYMGTLHDDLKSLIKFYYSEITFGIVLLHQDFHIPQGIIEFDLLEIIKFRHSRKMCCLISCIMITRPYNIQQYFTAVKMLIFR